MPVTYLSQIGNNGGDVDGISAGGNGGGLQSCGWSLGTGLTGTTLGHSLVLSSLTVTPI